MCLISQPKPDLVKGIRETFLRHLSSVLGNDDVAAHFVLLHLFSKVCSSRSPSLNLFHVFVNVLIVVIWLIHISYLYSYTSH